MSYDRKYRPKSFDDYIGNAKMKAQIFRSLNSGNRTQLIILSGFTGCGKTTMSRMIIREYMCEDRDPEKGACGKCPTCEEIDEYIETGSLDDIRDITEIDIGAISGKQGIQNMLEDVQNQPLDHDWKAYILDEFHQASDAAQSSLLKLFEEPPENVLFIIATTNPEKILNTIVGRAGLNLEVSKPTTAELSSHLANICAAEGVPSDPSALRNIAGMADNIIRVSLKLLEQCVNSRGSATMQDVAEEFDVVADDVLLDLIAALSAQDYVRYLGILQKLLLKVSPNTLITIFSRIVKRGVYVANGIKPDELIPEEVDRYSKVFNKFSQAELALCVKECRRLSLGDPEVNFISLIYMFQAAGTVTASTGPSTVHVPVSSKETVRKENIVQRESEALEDHRESLRHAAAPMAPEDVIAALGARKVIG